MFKVLELDSLHVASYTVLTQRGQITLVNYTILGLDNDFSFALRQGITWTKGDFWVIWPSGRHFIEIFIKGISKCRLQNVDFLSFPNLFENIISDGNDLSIYFSPFYVR